jgi:IS5 family transposase
MSSGDFFWARLETMIDLRHPLAVLASRLPWGRIEAELLPLFAHKDREGCWVQTSDLLGGHAQLAGGGVSQAGRPKLPIRLMASLLYLKHAFNLSDEAVVERWSENVVWQYFSGMEYYEPRLPCDATQVGRFRKALGDGGLEALLKTTIDTALEMKAIKPVEFERVIVDSTVQEKAIAHPVDSRLLEIARHKVATAAKRAGILLKQTFAREGRHLRRKAGGYAHAKQYRRLQRTLKRQRTILGIVMREAQRKLGSLASESAIATANLHTWLERAARIHAQRPKDKGKLYALHAPEVECISKGKARKRYEFGVKVGLVVTHKQGLMVGAKSFPGNPYDGHTLPEQLAQTTHLLKDVGRKPKQAIVDLGYRGVDAANPDLEIIHRGKAKSLTATQWRWLKRRQAIEPAIGHLKLDHRMDRCWLQGQTGDALHALSCALGYNIAWLLRAIARLGIRATFLRQCDEALRHLLHGLLISLNAMPTRYTV